MAGGGRVWRQLRFVVARVGAVAGEAEVLRGAAANAAARPVDRLLRRHRRAVREQGICTTHSGREGRGGEGVEVGPRRQEGWVKGEEAGGLVCVCARVWWGQGVGVGVGGCVRVGTVDVRGGLWRGGLGLVVAEAALDTAEETARSDGPCTDGAGEVVAEPEGSRIAVQVGRGGVEGLGAGPPAARDVGHAATGGEGRAVGEANSHGRVVVAAAAVVAMVGVLEAGRGSTDAVACV